MVELRLLDGTSLDLNPDEVIALTYAVNDIGSIETRQGVSSNEFELPVTDFNLRALGYPTNFNVNQNVSPFKKIDADIYEDELRIAKGYIQITNPSISGNSIPVVFFGENAEWFNLIKGKSIRELDLSEFDHIFNPSTINSSFSNTEGYKYALIDRNGLNFLSGNELSSQCFTLSIFQSTILKAIVESIDYKIKGSLLLDGLYKSTLIADTNDRFYALGQERDRSNNLGISAPFTISPSADNLIVFDQAGNLITESDNYDSGTYTADTSYFAKIGSTVYVENLGAGSTDVSLKLKVNGTAIATTTKTLATASFTFLRVDATGVALNDGIYYLLDQGDQVTVTISSTAEDIEVQATSITDLGGSLGTLILGNLNISINNIAVEGSNVACNSVLPDIDQADFVKDLVFDHNILLTVNTSSKEISFNFKNYNYNNFLDWSNNIDLSEDVEINYTDLLSDYNILNDVKRAETEGVFIKGYNSRNRINYGDGQIVIDNQFLDNRGDLFESEFGATFQINSLDTNQSLPYVIGDLISDTFEVVSFSSFVIDIPIDSDIEDFLEVPANSVWALITDSDNATYNRAYSISSITDDGTNYNINVNFTFGATATGVLRLVTRGEEATPRKLIDGGNFVIDENNDTYTSYDITSILPATEDSVTITSMPYLYFWNPIIGKPTDVLNVSLSYGSINVPSTCSNLLDDYYGNTIRTLQSGKILKASFRLNQVDIFNLDFNKLVYLNFYLNGQSIQGYFIINKVEEYTGQKDSTVVELIKY